MVKMNHFKALEDLYSEKTSAADKLAAYYTLKMFLVGLNSPTVVESDVPLLLKGINRQGAYEYMRRETPP